MSWPSIVGRHQFFCSTRRLRLRRFNCSHQGPHWCCPDVDAVQLALKYLTIFRGGRMESITSRNSSDYYSWTVCIQYNAELVGVYYELSALSKFLLKGNQTRRFWVYCCIIRWMKWRVFCVVCSDNFFFLLKCSEPRLGRSKSLSLMPRCLSLSLISFLSLNLCSQRPIWFTQYWLI